MLDIVIGSILFLSFVLMLVLSYINYKIMLITINMLEVTIKIKDVSMELLEVTKQLEQSFNIKEI